MARIIDIYNYLTLRSNLLPVWAIKNPKIGIHYELINYFKSEVYTANEIYQIIDFFQQQVDCVSINHMWLVRADKSDLETKNISMLKMSEFISPAIWMDLDIKSENLNYSAGYSLNIVFIDNIKISFGYDLFLTHEYLYYDPETMEYSDKPSTHYNPDWEFNKKRIEEVVHRFDTIVKELGFTKVSK